MYRKIKSVFFLTLNLTLFLLFYDCSKNAAKDKSDVTVSFQTDFEDMSQKSIWKNLVIKYDSLAFSGTYVCECPINKTYAMGFDLMMDDSIGNRNALFNIDVKLKSEKQPEAKFAFSIERNNEIIFWDAFPLTDGYVYNEWYESSFVLNVPNDVLKNSKLNCYFYNLNKSHFYIDDFDLNIRLYNLPTYVDEIVQYEQPEHIEEICSTKTINILYSEKENRLMLANDNKKQISKPLSMFHSLIVDNDTVELQSADWGLLTDVNEDNVLKFRNENDMLTTELNISFKDDDPNVNFSLQSKFLKDVNIIKSSLIIPFVDDDFIVYRKNMFVDTVNLQDVYYLDNEGFSLELENKQINLYHPDNVSSVQLDTKNSIAYINVDYFRDHFLIRFPLCDTSDYYVDNSAAFMKKGSVDSSSFVISLTDKTILPRIMPIFDGFESAFIWTEHADWTDIKTHRATYFGSEDVEDIKDAVGGFAYYDIPVTKSVFYDNPDSITNYDKNNDYAGFHSTIKTDSLFFDFLKQLNDNDFDICLHTPEQRTSNRESLSEALSFMKDNFASPSWIDHGYNNRVFSNREDMVCDGLDSTSPYYVYDLWKENGVKYIWNSSYEDELPFNNYLFYNNFVRPYPGFGDAFPLPRISLHPSYPDILIWFTHYTTEHEEKWAWDYFFSQERLDKIVDFRDVFIAHIYAPWVEEYRGFWEIRDGKTVAKEGFNSALEKIARMRDQNLMLPTTIADYMKYQQQLRDLEYRVEKNGDVVLKNNGDETIKGLSLITAKEVELDKLKYFNKRETSAGNEWIIWFDMSPDEEVKVLRKIK